ncbi:MAG: TonB-dependent receptor domain-containing protein [Gammaproteobacteria bacterium]
MFKINILYLSLILFSTFIFSQIEQPTEELRVTGTLIKSDSSRVVNPFFRISKEDLDKTGTFRLEDYLSSLPQITPSNSALQSGFSTGTASVSLRSLGGDRTLLLIDGKRLSPGTPFDGHAEADINQIPDALVKRIDVVTGGKSTIYGSDAIGGVINFILDRSFEGVKIDFQGGFYNHSNNNNYLREIHLSKPYALAPNSVSDGNQESISIVVGHKFSKRAHFTTYLNFREVDSVSWSERDISNCALSANAVCRGSSASKEGQFKIGVDTFYHVEDTDFISGSTTYNFASYNFLQRPDEKISTGLLFDFQFDDNHQLKTSYFYMHDETIAQIDYSLLFRQGVSIPCDNPFLSAQQVQRLCTDFGLTSNDSQSVTLSRRNFEGLPRQQDFDLTNNRFVIELEGKFDNGWNYNFFHQRSITDLTYIYFNDISKSKTANALNISGTTANPSCVSADNGCVPWNIFINNGNQVVTNPALGVTQEALDYINLNLRIDGSSNESHQFLSISRDLSVDNNLFFDPSIAFGLERRKTALVKTPDQNFESNDGAGQQVEQHALSGEIKVNELFLEVFLPFKNSIDVSTSYRFSDYSLSQKSDTFDLGITYPLTDEFVLKASAQKAIRVPDIHELFEETHAEFVALSSDPCSGSSPVRTLADCGRTGVTPSLYGSIETPASSIATTTGGNLNLLPERAITSSLGFILSNAENYLELDIYNIDLEDQIGTSDADTVLTKCLDTGLNKWCSLINRNPLTGTFHEGEGKINTPLLNFVSNKITGFDILYKKSFETKFGILNLSNFSNFLIRREIQQASSNIASDCRGKYENTCGLPSPKFQNILSIDLLTAIMDVPMNISLRIRHIDSVEDTNTDKTSTSYNENIPFKSFTYIDPSVKFSFDSFELRLGINNLFDQDPPVNGQIGYVPGNGNFYPSFYDSLGRFVFLRLSAQM